MNNDNNNEENLLGDNVEEILKQLGADKIAKAFEEITGHDCGCKKRRERLNSIHKWWKDLFRLKK